MEFKDLLEKHKEMQTLVEKEKEAIEALQKKIAWHEKKQRKFEERGSFFETVIYHLCEERILSIMRFTALLEWTNSLVFISLMMVE